MKKYSQKELSHRLSLYLDGDLNSTERAELEQYITAHEEAKKELQELKSLQQILLEQAKLEEDRSFWPRLSVSLQEGKAEHDNLLPFPRKFIPGLVALGALVVVLGSVALFQNRLEVGEFLSEKTKIVQNAYEQGVLKGSIFPLFSNIDRNEVLNFALFGTLPLDAKSETALRVDERAEKGYRIELGKNAAKRKPVTVKELQHEVQLTDNQSKVVDSMLAVMKKRIESSVLVSENDALVIDPELPKLNRVMVMNIAAFLEPPQRVRFNKFLEARDAQYAVKTHRAPRVPAEEVFVNIHKTPHAQKFVIVTPDTVLESEVKFDIDSFRVEFQHKMHNMPTMTQRADRLIRRLAERETFGLPRYQVIPKTLQIYGDSDAFNIEINRELPSSDTSPIQVEVRARTRRPLYTPFPPSQGYGFRFYAPMNPAQVDSMVVRFFEEGRSFDSAFSFPGERFQKRYPPKLDSLLRVMEQKRMEEARRKVRVDEEQQKQN